jgi:hypothetical protein
VALNTGTGNPDLARSADEVMIIDLVSAVISVNKDNGGAYQWRLGQERVKQKPGYVPGSPDFFFNVE